MFTRLRDIPITRRADYTKDWQQHYQSRLVTPEESVSHVKSGDHVAFCRGREPQALGLALAARRGELKNVRVTVPQPGRDFGWYDNADWGESFTVEIGYVSAIARAGLSEGFITYRANTDISESTPDLGKNPSYGADVYLVEVSPPDEHGFCSFGASVWDKPTAVRTAKLVMAEVNPRMIRTHGENYVHVTEIDYFNENPAPTGWEIASAPKTEAPTFVHQIAEHVSKLINHRDTIQIGAGGVTEWLPRVGTYDNHLDLGLFTEITPRGLTKLVADGVITNKYKSIHQGKCVSTAAGGSREDVTFIDGNPIFELYNVDYILNPLTVAAHENIVTCNQALAMDLTGQSTCETIGTLQYSGPGGQPAMVMGAMLGRGSRSIIIVPSTTNDGKQSRIVPMLPSGTSVSGPRYLADIVVSEYGVAHLRWKTLRERATELIKIAHPDFRAELERDARSRLWPS